MATMTPQSWAKDLLIRMKYPVTANNMTSVLAWEYAEGGHFHNNAHYNPLNTTMAHATYGSINGAGVATYPDYETGMRETIATLKLPAYGQIRSDLDHDRSPATTAAAIAASPWGTWHGIAPGPVVQRAQHDVKAHPQWYAKKSSPKKPSTGGAKAGSVVLDLDELRRLSSTYQNASDRVVQSRRRVQNIAAALQPALAALPDKAIAGAITANFNYVTESQGGLDRDARLLDELSQYTGDIRRLAEEADANSSGHWTKAEAVKWIEAHAGHTPSAAERAVIEALVAGRIVTKWPKVSTGSGSSGATHAPTSSVAKRVDAMLALAQKQHAVEHNGDNVTKYTEWYGANGQPWCAMFVSWVFYHSGNKLPAIQSSKGFAYVPYAISYARAHHQLHTTPKVGDIFLYKDGEHTGIVSKTYANGTFDTVEGNWSNQVSHVHRNSHDGTYWFWRPIN